MGGGNMRSNRTRNGIFGMILLAVFFAAGFNAHAQVPTASPSPTPKASATPTLESQFFKNILHDQKAIWTAPFHLHGSDARWLAPLGIGTAALIATDRRTGDELAEFHRQLNASRTISYLGSDYGVATIVGTFYFAGRAAHNERARET